MQEFRVAGVQSRSSESDITIDSAEKPSWYFVISIE
jgi:hypothetical protein